MSNLAESILHRGRVLWEDGTPVSGAIVVVASGTAPTPEIGIRANAHGEFRVALPTGTYQIEAKAPDGPSTRIDISIEGNAKEIELVLRR